MTCNGMTMTGTANSALEKCSELGQITNQMTRTPELVRASAIDDLRCAHWRWAKRLRRSGKSWDQACARLRTDLPKTAWTLDRSWGMLAPIGCCYCEQRDRWRPGKRGKETDCASRAWIKREGRCRAHRGPVRKQRPGSPWNRGGPVSRRGRWPRSLARTALLPPTLTVNFALVWATRAVAFRPIVAARRP